MQILKAILRKGRNSFAALGSILENIASSDTVQKYIKQATLTNFMLAFIYQSILGWF